MKTLRASVLFPLPLLLLMQTSLSNQKGSHQQQQTLWTPSGTWLNINNISTQFRNDGRFDRDMTTGNPAFVFPKGSHKTLVYMSGLLWGLKTDSLHVGGSKYSSGLQPGKILSPGVPEDPNLPKNRIYRVRPDYATADLSSEVRDEGRTAAAIRAQYATDWSQWPATDGAPFNDRNGNGIYEPGIDVPGFKGADQTIWFVCNDLDTGRTRALYGSSPVGIEMQVTIWAYDRPGALGNMLFKNFRLANKSTVSFDSMFVAQWMDTELGQVADEFAGCDTTLDLWFCYNSSFYDRQYGLQTPPVIGYQTPNMRTYAMVQKWSGSSITDPPNTYEGTGQWYNWMRGLLPMTGSPFYYWGGPDESPTRFWLDGDPITGTGRLDGYFAGPGVRRGHSTVGPFRMMPSDVRDISFVVMAGIGSNNVTGITELRKLARASRASYPLLTERSPVNVKPVVSYPSSSQATAQLVVDDRPFRSLSMSAALRRQAGALVSQVQLYDDGLHNDSAAHDGIWGNSVTISREAEGLSVDVTLTDSLAHVSTWEQMYDNLTTGGPLRLVNPRVFSDNINSNGQVNPGENVRYGFSVTNQGTFNRSGITVNPSFDTEIKFIRFNPIVPSGSDSLVYNPSDTLSYFTFTAPDSGAKTIAFTITDSSSNRWQDTLRFSVVPFSTLIYGSPVNHVAGITEWAFNVRAVDPAAINNHTYEITVVDSVDTNRTKAFNLRDVTTGTTLLQRHELPDQYGHNTPVTAGFKVARGANFGRLGLRQDSTRWISSSPAWLQGNRFVVDPQSAFNGGATTGAMLPLYLGAVQSNYDPYRSYPVEVRFNINAPQNAYRLRRIGSYLIQSYSVVPFSVWDVRDRTNPRQLAVAWRDQDNNGVWNPVVQSDNTEILFIYNKTYDPTGTTQFSMPPNAIPNECTMGANADIMYGLSLAIVVGHTLNESPGTLYLRPTYALNSNDRFTFNPTIILDTGGSNNLPISFGLLQNYPNPFNPSTTIQYQLPVASRITIKLYNILGQNVRTLVNGIQEPGYKLVDWNGTNEAGNSVASGVYFYRIEANGVSDASKSFTQTKKMLLLK